MIWQVSRDIAVDGRDQLVVEMFLVQIGPEEMVYARRQLGLVQLSFGETLAQLGCHLKREDMDNSTDRV